MRILAIRGQNIASLADRFEVDFTAEPLRSAGLFAITGETGAGKSSILDAMCLALYGDCPRLSLGGGNEDVPDAAGGAIKSTDARGVLRRGATSGGAEVDFVGLDGESYRASWSSRRARGRADGRLQTVERAIQRLSDGQMLESQINAVNARVDHLTGLTYDEFRRTVMLAQGDFDAFLRADDKERAALLEKVTGTEEYRDISMRVYERTEAAKTALATLTTRRDEHRLLSDEARAALDTERASLVAEGDAAARERADLTRDLHRHKALAEARQRLAAAQALSRAAEEAAQGAAGERALLAQVERAEPLRQSFDRLQRARADAAHAVQSLAAACATLQQADAIATTARADHVQAEAAHLAFEQQFKDLGPQWTLATQLDSQITGAQTESDRANTAAKAADTALAQAREALGALTQAEAQARARSEKAQAALDSHRALGVLAARWERVEQALDERQVALDDAATAQATVDALAQSLAASRALLVALDAADSTERARRSDLGAQAQAVGAQIAALEAEAPAERAEQLSDLLAILARLLRATEDHAAAQEEATAAHARQSEAAVEEARAKNETIAADAAIRDAEALAGALADPVDRAMMAASENARALRLRLVPGDACPVCGALDHPVHADAALAELAATLRADLDAARARAAEGRGRMSAATARMAAAGAAVRQAQVAQEQARLKSGTAALQYGEARKKAGVHDLPATPESALVPVQAAIARAGAGRQGALEKLRQIEALRREASHLDAAREGLTHALDARAGERAQRSDAIADAEKQSALALQRAATATARIAALDRDLAPSLAAGGASLADLEAGPQALRIALQDKVAWWTGTEAKLTGATTARAGLLPRLSAAQTLEAEATDTAAKARSESDTRDQAVRELTSRRAGLLGGAPTDAHRTRFNDRRLAAQKARDTARSALSMAENHQAITALAVETALKRQSETEAEKHAAAQDLQTASADLVEADLADLLSRPRAEIEALRNRLRGLDDAVTSARAAFDQRRADLAEAEAADLPASPPEALQAALDALEARQGVRQERVGAIASQLAADALSRAALADLETAITDARATLDVWQAVNAAVGSRQGDRFARLAQSITLDLLVDRANHHLSDLKPRYRLVRAGQELALHVIDRDMGDEIRSTRSLSGGERFLVSLSLALALSRMGGRGGLAATLFIDEGFGALDSDSLDLAIDALESLQSQGRMVGVISHVEAMKDRIPVQIHVQRQGGGRSTVTVRGLDA